MSVANNPTLHLSHFDSERLYALVDGLKSSDDFERANIERLRNDLDHAALVPAQEVPGDVVTMNSTVTVRDETGKSRSFTLVFPGARGHSSPQVSVLAPLGAAVLGYRVGDHVSWPVPGGSKRWTIEAVVYQPEAAGDFHR